MRVLLTAIALLLAPALSAQVFHTGVIKSTGYTNAPVVITFVQSKQHDAGGSAVGSDSSAMPTALGGGNLVVVAVRRGISSATISVSDSLGNTYTSAASVDQATGGERLQIFYAKAVVAGSATITVTCNGGTATLRWVACEYYGLSQTSPLDQTASQSQNATSTPSSSNTGTTTAANELLFVASSLSSGQTITAGSGYTLRENVVNKIGVEDQVVSSANVYNGSFTIGNSDNCATAIATFK